MISFFKKIDYIYFLIVFMGFFLFYLYTPVSLVDDAYITFRYSYHLVNGNGILWNLNEAPIEGYSNPLWMILASVFLFFKFNLETSIYWFNVLIYISLTLIIYFYFKKNTNFKLISFLIALSFLIYETTYEAYFQGLEMGLFALLITLNVLIHIRYSISLFESKFIFFMQQLLLFLLSVTRFEGFLLAFVISIYFSLFHLYRTKNKIYLIHFIVTFSIISTIFFFRFLYFGEFAPLSIHAKSSMIHVLFTQGAIEVIKSYFIPGIKYIFSSFSSIHLLFFVIVILMLANIYKIMKDISYIILFLVCLSYFIVLANGGDWMRGYRLVSTYIPIIYILIAIQFKNYFSGKHVLIVLSTISITILYFTPNSFSKITAEYGFNKYKYHTWNKIGQWMNQSFKKDDLLLLEQIGRMGYFAFDTKIIDFQGLANKEISKSKVKGSVFGKRNDIINFKKNPALIQTNSFVTLEKTEKYFKNSKIKYKVLLDKKINYNTILIVRTDVITNNNIKLPFKSSKWIDLNGSTNLVKNYNRFYKKNR